MTTSRTGSAAVMLPTQRPSDARVWFFVPVMFVNAAALTAVLVALFAYATAGDASVWIPVGLGVSIFVALHALLASRSTPWIPGLLGAIAALQWIIAPLAAYGGVQASSISAMSVPPDVYFGYAVPATIALIAGAFLPLVGARPPAVAVPTSLATAARIVPTCQAMVVGGVITKLFLLGFLGGSLWYAGLLVGQLSFVGAFSLALLRWPRWPWWVAAALGTEAMQAVAEGMFHDVLLWSSYFVLIVAFRYRVRWWGLLAMAIGGGYAVIALNGVKVEYRAALASGGRNVIDDAELLVASVVGAVSRGGGILDESSTAANISRLNQGWIIARVMTWVPSREPYAGGETVVTALRASLVPRLVAPDKYVAGASGAFQRFTGLPLRAGTSMNLGSAGEMYANFGENGGIAGMFVYGLVLGLLYRMFHRWAADSPLWWAWAPYAMFWTVQAESGIGEATNQVAKSLMVMIAVIAVVPGWRALRRWRRPRTAALSSPSS